MGNCGGSDKQRGAQDSPRQAPSKRGRILAVTGGSRGDQQPVVMVAARLKELGFDVSLCVGEEGKDWIDEYGFDWVKIANYEELISTNKDLKAAAQTGNFGLMMAAFGVVMGEIQPDEFKAIREEVAKRKDLVGIIGASLHMQVVEVVVRTMGIYGAALAFQPFLITAEFPPFFLDTRDPQSWQALPALDGSATGPFADVRELSGEINTKLWDHTFKMMAPLHLPALGALKKEFDAQDKFPQDDAGLMELGTNMWKQNRDADDIKIPHYQTMLAYGDILMPGDASAEYKASSIGYIFDSAQGAMSPFGGDVQSFLKAGDAPVYLGWGSMAIEKNDTLIRAAVRACKIMGKRGIILGGWAHLSLDMLDPVGDADLLEYANPEAKNILVVKKVNQIKLFPKCCCTVTHGGAGTTAAMLRGGKPCIITPTWADQNFMGDRIEAAGVGKRGPHIASITGEILAELITEVTTVPSYTEKAAAMGESIRGAEGGDAVAARLIAEQIAARAKAKKS